jgi:hypothetical protein
MVTAVWMMRQQATTRRAIHGSTRRKIEPDLHSCPFTAASRRNTASIERPRYAAMGCNTARLNLTDDRRDVSGKAISVGLHTGDRTITHSVELGIAEHNTAGLCGLQCFACAPRDQRPLFLGERSVEMQHERIGVAAKLCDDERHLVRHQAGNEMHIARQAVKLGNEDRAFPLAGLGERCGKLRATVESIRAPARGFIRHYGAKTA